MLSSSRHDVLNVSGIGNRARAEPIKSKDEVETDDSDSSPNDNKTYDITQFLLKMMQKDSPFFQNNLSSTLPQFDASEVSLDQNIGQGEFGVVFSIKAIRAPFDKGESSPIVISENTSSRTNTTHDETVVDADDSDDHHEVAPSNRDGGGKSTVQIYLDCRDITLQGAPSGLDAKGLSLLCEPNVSKGYMSAHAVRDGINRYAIKRLRKDLKGDTLVQATADLAAEANFLKSLRHPNICRMRGTIGEPGKKGFAIVLDRLTVTLRYKMMEWKKLDGCVSLLSKVKSNFLSQDKREDKLRIQKEFYGEKLMGVYDIARALRHLAEHSIIYRDLKPENIGIDLRGDLRLFDFGLAKELKEKDMTTPDMYNLTGMTGSRRYMAPEVITSKPYGLSADVYAYSILVWEVLSNRNAYSYLTLEKHFEMVVQRKKRPNLKKMVSKKVLPLDSNLPTLVKKCWSHKPLDRPSIDKVCDTLFSEILSASRDEKSKAAVDRSTHLAAGSLKSRLEETLWC